MTTDAVTAFKQLELDAPILKALDDAGYETPTPIQAQTIPLLLESQDVLGQAQTGTGKTAAFALPILSNIDVHNHTTQVLVLAPTRELAIQVADAFQKYGTHLKGLHVLPIYGGSEYGSQIRALKRGAHIVVGTPGRVMDHMRKGTLNVSTLTTLVLDEADEMLRMGFIDDVEWVLEQTPEDRQIALFSATMPSQIRRIATTYLNNPAQVTIKEKTTTATTIRQRYWMVHGAQKLDALARLLEAETFDGVLVFVRTKSATVDVTEKLAARGYSVAVLSGDVPQNIRERTVDRLKAGKLDILVATDVAARGLDVERISHVVNYDIPHDTEAYVHRIGRTGRAGRSGEAILFITPREKRMLQTIEKATRSKISEIELPSVEKINEKRIEKFKSRITETIEAGDHKFFSKVMAAYIEETSASPEDVAGALAKLVQGDTPLLLDKQLQHQASSRGQREDRPARGGDRDRSRGRDRGDRGGRNERRESFSNRGDRFKDRPERGGDRLRDRGARPAAARSERKPAPRRNKPQEEGMERFRIEVGHEHSVKPGNIVGAIANEAGLESKHIGRIEIFDSHSELDLPEGMPKDIFKDLKKVWVSGQQLRITKASDEPDLPPAGRPRRNDKSGGGERAHKPRPARAGGAGGRSRSREDSGTRQFADKRKSREIDKISSPLDKKSKRKKSVKRKLSSLKKTDRLASTSGNKGAKKSPRSKLGLG